MNTAKNAELITPDDDNDLAFPRSVYTLTAGNVVLIPQGGTVAVTFTAVAANTMLPVRAKRVLATGTTASLLGVWGI
jgi:hypothetical protein